jgi:dTDP-4-amino-4,6-dideoxygalactose transaminase
MKLAIDGGEKVCSEPLPQWPQFAPEAIHKVSEILASGKVNYWTGRTGREFEVKFAEYCGSPYAISTTNGTSALHTALYALGIGPGDEVICPSYTFIATAFSILQAGAQPVFADIDASHTIDPHGIERLITARTKAILVVHIFGIACDMAPILELARRYGLVVVEDCAQSLGGEYEGKKLGTLGDAGCFSFCQSKHFTTGGEGGAVTVRENGYAWMCRSFRDLGYEPEQRLEMFERGAMLNYIHERVGYNYRMTEMQSAIGMVELDRFESWNIVERRRNGNQLSNALAGHPAIRDVPLDTDKRRNAYWWAPFVLNLEAIRVPAAQFARAMRAEGISVHTVPWPEVYDQDAFRKKMGFGKLAYPFNDPNARPIDYDNVFCPKARELGEATIAFPVHPVYTHRQMNFNIEAFEKVYGTYAT